MLATGNADVKASVIHRIDDLDPAEWNLLAGDANPFLRHGFLAALEASGSVGAGTGWQPRHLALRDDTGALAAAMPLYLKSDSWGEFVFDFAWADAYRRAGLRYFPKLVAAVPFTPATGPRLLTRPGAARAPAVAALVEAALAQAAEERASSVHVLFPDAAGALELRGRGFLLRKDCQFHWHNRGYASFDDFLGEFTAEKRKKAKRERRRVAEAGITFRHLTGGDIDEGLWQEIMPLYGSSFWRRGREPYLNEDFFRRVARVMPEQLLVVLAMKSGAPVAVAILFRGADVLYGRYWGSAGDYHSLHFETCYYQGIEYCIEHGIARFEPGTQGEHKIARGFVPQEVWSVHWLSDPRFATAIDQYLGREREHVEQYMDVVRDHVPYRQEQP
jgi:hypothetical protein